MEFPMFHADERGVTHFGVQDVPERELAVGPPPNPTGQKFRGQVRPDLTSVVMPFVALRGQTERQLILFGSKHFMKRWQ